jgi:hypothetical protein
MIDEGELKSEGPRKITTAITDRLGYVDTPKQIGIVVSGVAVVAWGRNISEAVRNAGIVGQIPAIRACK